MYTVLVCVDSEAEGAAEQARVIADLPAAAEEIFAVVAHVFESNPEGASAHQLRSVRTVFETFDEAGISFRIAERSGDPVEQLLAEAEESKVDAICLGGRDRSPVGKAVFGSVAQRVLLESSLPVIVAAQE